MLWIAVAVLVVLGVGIIMALNRNLTRREAAPPLIPAPTFPSYTEAWKKEAQKEMHKTQVDMYRLLKEAGIQPSHADMFPGYNDQYDELLGEIAPADPNEGQNIQECPECGEQKRIPENDYVCKGCREAA